MLLTKRPLHSLEQSKSIGSFKTRRSVSDQEQYISLCDLRIFHKVHVQITPRCQLPFFRSLFSFARRVGVMATVDNCQCYFTGVTVRSRQQEQIFIYHRCVMIHESTRHFIRIVEETIVVLHKHEVTQGPTRLWALEGQLQDRTNNVRS